MRAFVATTSVCLLVLYSSGCKSNRPEKATLESSRNLAAIRDAYFKAIDKQRRPPASREEILADVKDAGDPDEILRSPLDGQDYVILWGTDPRANPVPVVAYERLGKDGWRYVLRGHVVFFLNEEEFRKLPFPQGHTAP